MFDDIQALFYEGVIIPYAQYMKLRDNNINGNSNDIRAALHAISAAFHFREHLPEEIKKSRSDTTKLCSDYKLIGDMTNSSKHKSINTNNPLITQASDIYEAIIITTYSDEIGEYQDARKAVLFKTKDEIIGDVSIPLTNVVNYWGSELLKFNLIPSFKRFPVPEMRGLSVVPRHHAAAPNFIVTKGVRFHQHMLIQKFNYTSRKPEPVDLTGHSGVFRIYNPSEQLVIVVRNESTKKTYEMPITLSPAESISWRRIDAEPEKIKFLERVAELRQEEIGRFIRDSVAKDKESKQT